MDTLGLDDHREQRAETETTGPFAFVLFNHSDCVSYNIREQHEYEITMDLKLNLYTTMGIGFFIFV